MTLGSGIRHFSALAAALLGLLLGVATSVAQTNEEKWAMGEVAAELQQCLPGFPLVGSGYSYLREFLFQAGAANVRDGRVTLVGVGRAALSQPDFVRRLMTDGQLNHKRVCRTFSYCTALMRSKHNEMGQFATGCPPFDKEVYGPIWGEAKKK